MTLQDKRFLSGGETKGFVNIKEIKYLVPVVKCLKNRILAIREREREWERMCEIERNRCRESVCVFGRERGT